jgi:PAT family beta-lactamase induction signal transducer AmpG
MTPSAAEQKDYPKLVVLGVLHMAQFFPYAFTATALPFMFRKEGLPLEMFWLLALPNIPRWFKWLLALVVDNYGSTRFGYRKTWIVPCTIIGALAYAVLAWIPPSLDVVYLIVAILFFKSFVMAAQDIAVDAYATESMSDAERPVGTSIINFLGALAGVLGTGTIALVETFGWSSTMFAASALLIIAALPAIIRREPPPPEASRARQARGERPDLLKALKRRDYRRYILPFGFLYGFGVVFMSSMVGVFFADKGLTLTQFGILAPISAIVGSSLAAIATPWLINRIGFRKTTLISVCALPIEGAMFCAFAVLSLPVLPMLIAMVSLLGFATGLFNYTTSISRYRWSSKAQAGTDYSLQSSFMHLGAWASGSVSGLVVAQIGWVYFFPLASVVAMVAAVFYVVNFDHIEALVRDRERLELPPEQDALNA